MVMTEQVRHAEETETAPLQSGVMPLGPLDPSQWDKSLFQLLIEAKNRHGSDMPAWENEDQKLTFNQVVTGAFVLGKKIEEMTEPGENVGVLMPTVPGSAVVFFSLFATGRTAAVINYTVGGTIALSACRTAQVKRVLTSRLFIKKADLQPLVDTLSEEVEIVYLEDVRKTISVIDKAIGFMKARFASPDSVKGRTGGSDIAVILFTSGTEGEPKGVALSHKNFISNAQQAAQVMDFGWPTKVFMCLPLFHSFGFTAGVITPVICGWRMYMYPSPLHYHSIPKQFEQSEADILVGTDTFAFRWARNAKGHEFKRLKAFMLGAEKVKQPTRDLWEDKCGVELCEAYGVTEASPCVAGNSNIDNRHGTVGKILPGLEWRLDPVEGVTEGGRLYLRGPNIMEGYIKPAKPGVVQPPEGGWHDTGDIVTVDEDSILTIRGRAKRFAKIGGEMVSLAAVEEVLDACWPENRHCVVNLPDPKRGEKLIAVTDKADPSLDEFRAFAKERGLPELMVPREMQTVDQVPVLGSGKVNFRAARDMVEAA